MYMIHVDITCDMYHNETIVASIIVAQYVHVQLLLIINIIRNHPFPPLLLILQSFLSHLYTLV